VLIRREDRVEHAFDKPVRDDHGQPREEPHSAGRESRQLQGIGESQGLVGQEGKGQVQPACGVSEVCVGVELQRCARVSGRP
jgi:hypothetical protein